MRDPGPATPQAAIGAGLCEFGGQSYPWRFALARSSLLRQGHLATRLPFPGEAHLLADTMDVNRFKEAGLVYQSTVSQTQ